MVSINPDCTKITPARLLGKIGSCKVRRDLQAAPYPAVTRCTVAGIASTNINIALVHANNEIEHSYAHFGAIPIDSKELATPQPSE
jgi:hypothetical protein